MWKFLSHANWAYEEIRTLTDETSPSDVYRDNITLDMVINAQHEVPLKTTGMTKAIFDSCHSGSIVDLEYRYLPPPPVRRPSKLRKPRLSVTEGTQNKKNQSNTLALMVLSSMTISVGPAIEPASSHERRSTTGNPTNDEFDYHDGERVQSPIEMTPLHRAFSTGKTLADVLWEHREAYKVNDVGYSRGQVITISAASDTKEMFELPKDNSGLLTDSLITVVQKHNHNVSWCKLIDEMTLLFAIRNAERKQHALEYHVHPVLSTNKAGMNLRDRFQL
ncbi:hypothetical protein FRC17_009554 [Serendipita sp. 399]|nr:hypothetical protein FRC17_009554 [Serendipita sp. 399]